MSTAAEIANLRPHILQSLLKSHKVRLGIKPRENSTYYTRESSEAICVDYDNTASELYQIIMIVGEAVGSFKIEWLLYVD